MYLPLMHLPHVFLVLLVTLDGVYSSHNIIPGGVMYGYIKVPLKVVLELLPQ